MEKAGSTHYTQLLPGMTVHDRYEVRKILSQFEHHAVYMARDIRMTGRTLLLKEYHFSSAEKAGEGELCRRDEAYEATVEVITHFEHPALPPVLDSFYELNRHYIVTEPVDGLTLKALTTMSIEPLPEAQVLEWAIQICDALSYLHSRPKPFIGSMLDPDHIMVVMGEEGHQIRLVNLGLNRFFDLHQTACAFSSSIIDITHDFFELGRTLYYLFSKTEFDRDRFSGTIPDASEATAKIIRRLLSSTPQRNYRDASELKRELQCILHPPKPVKEEIDIPEQKVPPFNFLIPRRETVDRAIFAVLSQNVSVFFLEIGLIIVAAILLYMHLRPGWNYTKTEPVVLCACQGELLTYNARNAVLLDRQSQEGTIRSMAFSPRDENVYLLDQSQSLLKVLEKLHNQTVYSVRTDRGPSSMLLFQSLFFVLSESTSNISMVSMDKKSTVSIIPTGAAPLYLDFLPSRNLLFVSDTAINAVHVLDPLKNITKSIITIPGGAGPLALDPDGNTLYIANTRYDGITMLDVKSLSITGQLMDLGLKKPCSMRISPDRKYFYIIDREAHSLTTLSTYDNKKLSSLIVGKNPSSMTFDESGKIWIANWGSHNIAVVNPWINRVERYINTGRKPQAILHIH